MKDAQGNDIPGSFTEAEVQAKVAEATAAAKKESEAAVTAAQTEVTTLKQKLDGLSDKDKNFGELRTQLEAATKRLGDLENATTGSHRTGVIAKLAGSDAELKKKIEHHYNETLKSMPATTPEEISARAEAAFKLSADITQPDPFKSIRAAGISGGASPGASPVEISPELREGAKLFGITDKDLEKHLPKK